MRLSPRCTPPALGTPPRQVYDAILPVVVDLVGEVRRSIDYYANKFPDSRVDKILTLRRHGQHHELRRLPRPPRWACRWPIGNPFLRVEVDRRRRPGASLKDQACFMPIVVGLGDSGHARLAGAHTMIKINLLPPHILEGRKVKGVVILMGIVFLACVILPAL